MARETNCRISRQRLALERLIGERIHHLTLSRMVGFPLPVGQIWRSHAQVQAVTGRVRDNKVLVEGIIAVQLFWVPAMDNREICELKLEEKFSQFVEIPGASRGQVAEVRARVERMEYTRMEVKGQQPSEEELRREPAKGRQEPEGLSSAGTGAPTAELRREPATGEAKPQLESAEGVSGADQGPKLNIMADGFRQDILVELEVKVRQSYELDVITQVEVPGIAAKVRREKLRVEQVVALGGRDLSLTRQIHFPRPAAQLKGAISRLIDFRAWAEPGKIAYQGIWQQQLLYLAAENRRIYEMTLEEPISGELPVAGAGRGMRVEVYGYPTSNRVDWDEEEKSVGLGAEIEELDGDSGPTGDPPRVSGYYLARSEMQFHLFYRLVNETQLEAVTEVRAPGLVVDKARHPVDAIVAWGQGEEVLARAIAFPRPVARLAASSWHICLNREDTMVGQDEVMVAARLKEEFLAVDYCHGGIFSYSPPDHPVEFMIRAPGARPGLLVRVEVRVEKAERTAPSYPEEICQQVADKTYPAEAFPWQEELLIGATAWVMEPRMLQLVKAVKLAAGGEQPAREAGPRASIRYYLIQPGDTWDTIAERYGMVGEALKRLNPELEGWDGYDLPAGRRLRLL